MEDATVEITSAAGALPEMTAASNAIPLGLTPASFPQIDGYRILSLLGAGGMGDVFHAVQLSTRREVALKLMRGSFASEKARMRFDREVELTARLDHANIARVFDSGLHHGVYFYAMERIEGVPLDQFVAERGLDCRAILTLFRTVCLAVAHAHLRGVIHRDLKPSNILVSADGQAHVVDFGLAKALADAGPTAHVSMEGEWAGTPAYMSPEQAAGHADRLDTRTDVYSLGVILYKLLTNEFPHDISGRQIDLMKRVCDDEVRRPRQVMPHLDRELESLLLKALARSPEDRYPSAGELARDVDNFLRGEPLVARAPTLAYFARKRMWKYRLPLTLAAAVAAVLLATAIFSYLRIERAVVEKEKERRGAELARAMGLVREGDALMPLGRRDEAKARYADAGVVFGRESVSRLWADLGLWNAFAAAPAPMGTLRGEKGGINTLALSGDGRVAVTGSRDGSVRVWDLPAARPARVLGAHQGEVWNVALSADAGHAITGGSDGSLILWDVNGAEPPRKLGGLSGWVTRVAISPDGRRALSVSGETRESIVVARNDTLTLWDLAAGRPSRQFQAAGRVARVVFSPQPDAPAVVLVSGEGGLALWDAEKGTLIRSFRGNVSGISAISFSPDGRRVVCGATDGGVRVWDAATGQLRLDIARHSSAINAVEFGPMGKTILSADETHSVQRWDSSGNEALCCTGPRGEVRAAAFSADGRIGVCAAADDTLTLWDLADPIECRALAPAGEEITAAGFLAEGRLAACCTTAGPALWDVATGRRLHLPSWQPGPADGAAVSPDGRSLAAFRRGVVTLWDTASLGPGRSVALPWHGGVAAPLVFSPNGKLLLAPLTLWQPKIEHDVAVIDVDAAKVLRRFRGHTATITSLAFSPDGRSALSSSEDQTVRLWDVSTGAERLTLKSHKDSVNAIAFSPDGKKAVSGGGNAPTLPGEDDFALRIWDLQTGDVLHTCTGHTGRVRALALIPDPVKTVDANGYDATMIASGGDDKTIRFWDLASGKELRALPSPAGGLQCLALRANPLALLCGGTQRAPWLLDFTAPAEQSTGGATAAAALQNLWPKLPPPSPLPPADPGALVVGGQWWAGHQLWDWAAEDLERARAAGAAVDPLTTARCDWALGHLEAAEAEFKQAMESAAGNAALREELNLCLETVQAETADRRAGAKR